MRSYSSSSAKSVRGSLHLTKPVAAIQGKTGLMDSSERVKGRSTAWRGTGSKLSGIHISDHQQEEGSISITKHRYPGPTRPPRAPQGSLLLYIWDLLSAKDNISFPSPHSAMRLIHYSIFFSVCPSVCFPLIQICIPFPYVLSATPPIKVAGHFPF